MRILVTGASGQVGVALAARLAPAHEAIAPTRAGFDLAEPERLAERLDALRPDMIVNCAAYTAVDRAENERDLAFAVNAEAPAAMARWARAQGVPLIQLSTDYVFDGSEDRPWREDDRPAPLSGYGASKLAGEDAVRAAAGAHLIVRTSWVYAAEGRNFLRTVARLSGEREELRIVDDQTGAPTPAALVAQGLAAIVDTSAPDFSGAFARAENVVHLCASGETTWFGFASAIVDGLRARGVALAVKRIVPIASDDHPAKARRPKNSRLSLERLRRVFGIEPPRWDEMLPAELERVAHLDSPSS
ncbi:MAG: dTDP-4-dehydrorhamnose reductase [Pseudorhodoplanes sp.]|nr:dTDP-4-dehydrorhamnose reductase [Pseudorhodoplanes sp.]